MNRRFAIMTFASVLFGTAALAAEPPASIGTATMDPDGTIKLQLVAQGGGAIGDALIVYKPNDPHYAEVLQHLGGLKPGETKPVPPWPDEKK